MREGALKPVLLKEGHPAPEKSRQPYCTRSQIIAYVDADNNEAALVHQYLRPDGTLGASGKPDPKRMTVGDVIYYV